MEWMLDKGFILIFICMQLLAIQFYLLGFFIAIERPSWRFLVFMMLFNGVMCIVVGGILRLIIW